MKLRLALTAAALAFTSTACLPDTGPDTCTPLPILDRYDDADTGIIYESPTSTVRVGYKTSIDGPMYADPRCLFPVEMR